MLMGAYRTDLRLPLPDYAGTPVEHLLTPERLRHDMLHAGDGGALADAIGPNECDQQSCGMLPTLQLAPSVLYDIAHGLERASSETRAPGLPPQLRDQIPDSSGCDRGDHPPRQLRTEDLLRDILSLTGPSTGSEAL